MNLDFDMSWVNQCHERNHQLMRLHCLMKELSKTCFVNDNKSDSCSDSLTDGPNSCGEVSPHSRLSIIFFHTV